MILYVSGNRVIENPLDMYCFTANNYIAFILFNFPDGLEIPLSFLLKRDGYKVAIYCQLKTDFQKSSLLSLG